MILIALSMATFSLQVRMTERRCNMTFWPCETMFDLTQQQLAYDLKSIFIKAIKELHINEYASEVPYICHMPKLLDAHQWGGICQYIH